MQFSLFNKTTENNKQQPFSKEEYREVYNELLNNSLSLGKVEDYSKRLEADKGLNPLVKLRLQEELARYKENALSLRQPVSGL